MNGGLVEAAAAGREENVDGEVAEEVHYRGVRKRGNGKYTAQTRVPKRGSNGWLGTFKTRKEAALAYDRASIKFRGFKDKTNFLIPKEEMNRTRSQTNISGDGSVVSESSWIINVEQKPKRIEIDLNLPPPPEAEDM
ncbi:Ethylene-responsive transcription factor 4 [Capsicum annuum]|nr:Ethylene-responsive transcription factor 4 [Capsicum annuum]